MDKRQSIIVGNFANDAPINAVFSEACAEFAETFDACDGQSGNSVTSIDLKTTGVIVTIGLCGNEFVFNDVNAGHSGVSLLPDLSNVMPMGRFVNG